MTDFHFLEFILQDKDIFPTGDKSNPADKIFEQLKELGKERAVLKLKNHKEIKTFTFTKFTKVHEMKDG